MEQGAATSRDKQLVFKSIYEANWFGKENSLSYLEIRDKTGIESHQVLTAAKKLQEEGYLSRFLPYKGSGYVSFGLSSVVLEIFELPEYPKDITEKISQVPKTDRH